MICASIRSPTSSPWSRSHGARFKSTPPGTALPKRDTLPDLQSTARDDGSSATLTGLHQFPPTSPQINELDSAFVWLEREYVARSSNLITLKMSEDFAP